MPLTDTAVRNAKPGVKPVKLTDGGGLYLLVSQAGKYWRWDYRFMGKRKTLAFGVYPDVSLGNVRKRHQEARTLLADGVDPGEARKTDKRTARIAAENSFELVARSWLEWHKGAVTPGTQAKVVARYTARRVRGELATSSVTESRKACARTTPPRIWSGQSPRLR